ncbi:MAG: TIGR04086 family membrane protein [Vallitalea sp.]|jgi:putative membrane protein (TIGR04086 family)|nr:TIGR04086 family membrane protein [Vallitalea sp.]
MSRVSRISKKPDINTKKIAVNLSKSVMIGYIITIICVLILTFVVYKHELTDSQINIGRVIVIILATLITGLLSGKSIGKNKWMYGAIAGVIYFIIFVIVSLVVNKDSSISGDVISLFFMCVGGSTLGGILG